MKTLKIGRNHDNDIIIKDETLTVSGFHAVIKVYDRTFTICDNSTNGTYINGVKVTKNIDVSVKRGDEIRLGPHVLFDWTSVAVPSVHRDATEIDTDEKASYTIGTESDNKIVIVDSTNHVSRHHAVLKLKHDGKYYIFDQSTNGTYVNGVKIKSKVDFPVSVTDSISLSNSHQLDWKKIPNVSIPKPAPIVAPPDPKPPVNNVKTVSSNTNYWSYIIVPILIAVVYFVVIKPKNVNKETSVEQTPANVAHQTLTANVLEPQMNNPIAETQKTDISTLYEQNKDAVFVIYTSNETYNFQGSGFFISSLGVAVSNYHVFKGTSKGLESIKTKNGTFKVESVLNYSEDNDYIVFKVAGNAVLFPYLKIANSLPRVGEDVFAIGAPQGLELTLSKGIISALRADNSIIQTTTEITHGSSGGPLFNMQGEVIGITSAGMGEADLNFAVSIVGKGFENIK